MELSVEDKKEMEKGIKEAFEAMDKYYSELQQNKEDVLKQIGIELNINQFDLDAHFIELLDDCIINGEIEIVANPSGGNQHSDCGIFTEVFVEQWSVGDSGDSYSGYIFGKYSTDKWIKIPYETD